MMISLEVLLKTSDLKAKFNLFEPSVKPSLQHFERATAPVTNKVKKDIEHNYSRRKFSVIESQFLSSANRTIREPAAKHIL